VDENAIDSSGSNGPALTDYITSLTGGAAGILGALRPAAAAAPKAVAPAIAAKTNYTPWIIGGGIVAVLLFVLVIFKR